MNLSNRNCTLGERTFSPPLLLAPMAGITHSAFRRLVADFGGYGALFTEMLSGASLTVENTALTPFTRRRESEGNVIYQLYLTGREDLARVIEKLKGLAPYGIDINLGCPAPEIRKSGGGVELFEDEERLLAVLSGIRNLWNGLLTVKCRLGKRRDDWQKVFARRLKIFEETGVDALTVHPRFSDEKLKRVSRTALFPWIASLTRLPIIANGDLRTAADVEQVLERGGCRGAMIGRMAVVKPWIFKEICQGPLPIDYGEVWARFFEYTCEDFRPEKAIGRIKEFTAYFSRNFIYGHQLYKKVQGSSDLSTLRNRALEFLSASPAVEKEPSVMGI